MLGLNAIWPLHSQSEAVVGCTEYDAFWVESYVGTTTDRGSYRFAGQKGYPNDDATGMQLLGARYYLPLLGRFLTQDPIGHEGGLNLYAYCSNSPLLNVDPDGTQDSYLGSVWNVLRGEGAALNPINWAKGAWNTGFYLGSHGGSLESFKTVGGGILDGLSFWNKDDPYEFGQSFMSFELAVAPALKGIPLGLSRAGSVAEVAGTVGRFAGRVSGRPYNYGLGSLSWDATMAAGRRFLGPGFRSSNRGAAWLSADGLRQFRPPTFKPRQGYSQANFQSRAVPRGEWKTNGHVRVP